MHSIFTLCWVIAVSDLSPRSFRMTARSRLVIHRYPFGKVVYVKGQNKHCSMRDRKGGSEFDAGAMV
jgi:hypothetical protein